MRHDVPGPRRAGGRRQDVRRAVAAAVLALVAAAIASPAGAQPAPSARAMRELRASDSTRVVILRTSDGSSLVGRVLAVEGDSVVRFATVGGTLAIPLDRVRDVDPTTQGVGAAAGETWFANPNATRLLFAPTGRMLRRGDGYFSDYYVVLPGFAYGITDQFSVGGGMSLIPGLDEGQLFYFTPKVGVYQSPKVNVAAGAVVAGVPGGNDEVTNDIFGILYGVATFGTPDASLTTGLGYGYARGDLADKPAALLGAELRLSRRMAFVSENYVLPSVDQPLVSYGLRFLGEKSSLDLGFVNTLGEDAIFPGIPYVGFVFNF